MTNAIPGWIGHAGFYLMLAFLFGFLGGHLGFAIAMLIPLFILAYLENRYENGGEKPDPMHFE